MIGNLAGISDPWSEVAGDPDMSAIGGRPCLIAPGAVERVLATSLSEELPLLSDWDDDGGRRWKKFELPAAGSQAGRGPISEILTLSLRSREHTPRRLEIRLEGGIPKLSRQDIDDDEDLRPDEWQSASIDATGLIDRHIDLVNRLYDETQPQDNHLWQGHAEGLAVRPLTALLDNWYESGQRDEPRMALIVRLQRRLAFRKLLTDVCGRPRRILARRRQMQKIARIQQVDPACIRWIVRQPGITLAQKAGTRQEALGVVRTENADTPENRVVRDLIRRATLACARYIRQNRRFHGQARVQAIRQFRKELRTLLRFSDIAEVRPLVGIPRPNYVLQQDSRYAPLWQVYLLLVKQQMQQDEAWQWRHRIWAEHTGLAIMACLREMTGESGQGSSDTLIRPEQLSGKFVDPRCSPSPWQLVGGSARQVVDFVKGEQMMEHCMIVSRLDRLCPDFVLVRRTAFGSRPISMLAVWTVLDFDIHRDLLRQRARSISQHLKNVSTSYPINGMLIQPRLGSSEDLGQLEEALEHRCRGIRLAVDLQGELQGLTSAICSGLELNREG